MKNKQSVQMHCSILSQYLMSKVLRLYIITEMSQLVSGNNSFDDTRKYLPGKTFFLEYNKKQQNKNKTKKTKIM